MRDHDAVKNYTFTLILEGPNPLTDRNLDALFEAGCSDATFGKRGAVYFADFDREALSLAEAIASAVIAIEKAVPGLRVVRVEPEDLVNASDIAARTGKSREGTRLLVKGKRGPGHFPNPAVWLSGKRPLWRWWEVANWYRTCFGEEVARNDDVTFVATLNAALDLRRLAPRLSRQAERAFIAKVIEEDRMILQA